MSPSPATPDRRKDHLDGLAVALLVGCCAFWGFQQVLVKSTITELPPIFQAGFRLVGATLLLWAWCQWRGIPLWQRDGSLRAGLLAGMLFAIEFVFIYTGLLHTGAARLTVLLYTAPLWVALVLPFLVKSERLRGWQWFGLAIAFGGVAMALSDGLRGGHAGSTVRGDLMALAAGACWGLTTVVIRSSVLVSISAEKLLFYQVAVGGLVLPILSLGMGEAWTFQWSTAATVSMLIQTVAGAFGSFLVWMWILGRYPATKVSVFVFLTPVFALGIGAAWLGEPITAQIAGALALVVAGIVLVGRKPSVAATRSA
jgi:drug/metabolite transporter (DMT)-like permease